MTLTKTILLLFLSGLIGSAAAQDTATLEARLKETAETSQTGAGLILELIGIYERDGQVFGLIRTASKFARAQQDHPRRAEMTLKLIDSYAATARHDDIITSARQFLEIIPTDTLANEALPPTARHPEPTHPYLAAEGIHSLSLRENTGTSLN